MALNPWPILAAALAVWVLGAAVSGVNQPDGYFPQEAPEGVTGWFSYLFDLTKGLFVLLFDIGTLNLSGVPWFIRVPWTVIVAGTMVWAIIESVVPAIARVIDAIIPG